MSSSTAELTLILKAQNLAKGAVADLRAGLDGIRTTAQTAGAQLVTAFAGKGQALVRELGALTTSLLTGTDLTTAAINLGATVAGGLVTAFGEQVVAKLAGSALLATIGGALSTAGAAIGSAISAAIPVGMAAAPALLLAAVVAAIAFLVTHPEIAAKVLQIAGDIVRGIVGGIAGLVKGVLGVFGDVFRAVLGGTASFIGSVVGWYLSIPGKIVSLGADIVRTIIGGLASFPGKVAAVVREAFANLKIDVGPFHISASGVRIDLPDITTPSVPRSQSQYANFGPQGHASGGWVGLNGPELGWFGERGPEYVVPNNQLGSVLGGGVRLEGVSMADIDRAIDEGMLFRLRRAGTGLIAG